MNGPSARALREARHGGGMGGSIPYKTGVTCGILAMGRREVPGRMLHGYAWMDDRSASMRIGGDFEMGGPMANRQLSRPAQAPFGDFGQILRIDVSETQRCAYVEYEDSRDAQDAAKDLNGSKIAGKEVSVVLASAAKRMGSGTSAAPAGPPSRAVDLEQRVAELAMKHFLDDAAAARLASARCPRGRVFQDRSRLGCDLVRDLQECPGGQSRAIRPGRAPGSFQQAICPGEYEAVRAQKPSRDPPRDPPVAAPRWAADGWIGAGKVSALEVPGS
eukprot:Skav224772  [mRNA]  locus=scaffold1604:650070:658935:- [translate_table: standard]